MSYRLITSFVVLHCHTIPRINLFPSPLTVLLTKWNQCQPILCINQSHLANWHSLRSSIIGQQAVVARLSSIFLSPLPLALLLYFLFGHFELFQFDYPAVTFHSLLIYLLCTSFLRQLSNKMLVVFAGCRRRLAALTLCCRLSLCILLPSLGLWGCLLHLGLFSLRGRLSPSWPMSLERACLAAFLTFQF